MRASVLVWTALTTNLASPVASAASSVGAVADSLPFSYKSYGEMVSSLHDLSNKHPELASIYTTQDLYNLPTVGSCGGGEKCKNYLLVVEDKAILDDSHVVDTDPHQSVAYRPDVFFSGEVHGDETVGPLATLHAAELMLTASSCARVYYEAAEGDRGGSKDCQTWFQDWKYTELDLHWLSSLVAGRRVIFSPMSNAEGFAKTKRTEKSIDPNRDFPFDVTSDTHCMRTVAARHINEVFQHSLIQLAITFHGGMTAIAYEWGAPSHNSKGHKSSPDNIAQRSISSALSDYGGTFSSEIKYPFDPMNEIVYPVHGGMEDWAYAGSWDSPAIVKSGCNPSTYGGYPRERTIYGDGTLRAFNLLVEASKIKKPNEIHLGGRIGLFDPLSTNNGHVPRNLRLTLMMIDMVEPIVNFVSAKKKEASNWVSMRDRERVPGIGRNKDSCRERNRIVVKKGGELQLKWQITGAMEVDETDLIVVKDGWASGLQCMIDFYAFTGSKIESRSGEFSFEVDVIKGGATSGQTRWSNAADKDFQGSDFTANFTVDDAGEYVIIARARVDSRWAQLEHDSSVVPIDTPPQSHVVNSRINEAWTFENDGKKIEGRLDWWSTPLTIVVVDDNVPDIKDAGRAKVVNTYDPKEDSGNFDRDDDKAGRGGSYDGDANATGGMGSSSFIIFIMGAALLATGYVLYTRNKRNAASHKTRNHTYEMVAQQHTDPNNA